MTVINLDAYREAKAKRDYIAYYGTPVEVVRVKRPTLVAVEDYTEDDIAQLQGSIDMSSYMDWLEQLEDIDSTEVDIIQWNPNIAY